MFLVPVTNPKVHLMSDINAREMLILGVLAVATIYMGLHPKPFTDPMEASVQQLIEHVSQGKVALLGNNL